MSRSELFRWFGEWGGQSEPYHQPPGLGPGVDPRLSASIVALKSIGPGHPSEYLSELDDIVDPSNVLTLNPFQGPRPEEGESHLRAGNASEYGDTEHGWGSGREPVCGAHPGSDRPSGKLVGLRKS